MKRKALLVLTLIAAGWTAREFLLPDPIFPVPIRSATPEQVGLVWQECELPIPAFASGSPLADESVACFGHAGPTLAGDEGNPMQFIDKTHLRMTVGQDVYEARANDLSVLTVYTLNKNGNLIRSLIGLGDTLWLHMFLSSVDGHLAWGIANENPSTIIFDGKDLRRVYGLDKAHAAYGLAGKLLFVAQKENKYFVLYDGQKVGPEYDQITIGYCCETGLYTARGGQGRYQFRGRRGGKEYIVEISASNAPAQLSAPDAPSHEDARGYWETVLGQLTLDEYAGRIYFYDWYAIEIAPDGQAVVTWDNGIACSKTEARVQGKEIRLVADDVDAVFVILDGQHAIVTFRRGWQVYVKLLVKTRDDPRVICS